jgi:PleD family two-component response regulator
MIVAVLDDLMFTSKIRTTAAQLGVDVRFIRNPDAALAEMRERPPSLVILDLNNPRSDPLGIVAALKKDAALAGVRTIGYVSHVQTEVIDRARQAGVDTVLARSAFTQQLADILRQG